MAKLIESLHAGLTNNGRPLSFGRVEFYQAGTNLKKTVYLDRTGSIISANPVTLDINGRAVIFGEGIYKVVLKDQYGKVISTADGLEFTNASTPTIEDIKRTGNANIFDNSDFSRWSGGAPDRSAHMSFGGQIVTADEIESNVSVEQDTDGSVKITPSAAPWYWGYRFDNLTSAMEALEQFFRVAAKVKASSTAVVFKVFNGSEWIMSQSSGGGEFEQLTPNAFQYVYNAGTDYIDIVVGSETDTSIVNLSDIWGNVGEVLRPAEPTVIDYLSDSSLTGFAGPNGDPGNAFEVAEAVQATEAPRKSQMDAADADLQNQIDTNADDITDNANAISGKEPAFSKNSAFNKNFGTVAGTVCQGNDSRLSDARIPTSHGNDKHTTSYEPAFSKNSAFNKNFGSAVGTVCQGNDSRLSDARTPTEHNHDNRYYTESEVNNLLNQKVDKSVSMWQTATLLNGHAHPLPSSEIPDFQYRIDQLGRLCIRGAINMNDSTDAHAFTFPSGFRPPYLYRIPDWGNDRVCSLNPDGTLVMPAIEVGYFNFGHTIIPRD